MNLRAFHRAAAAGVLLFAATHIANHLASLSSIATHIAFMDAARSVYRRPVIEVVLLCWVAFQIASGLWLFFRGWPQRTGRIPWLQALSGAYLAFFLLVHVGAVLLGRLVLRLDTNFYFAAAGLNITPYQFFFAPYYFLAVLALFTHLGCAAYWRYRQRPDWREHLPSRCPC
jgi:succinate dehydrogenase/fumarate reductase cytochrome b subunit